MEFMKTTYDEKERIWSGEKSKKYFDTNCSLGEIIFKSMRNHPKNICQISDIDGKVLTNQEALTYAIRIAQHFKKLGLKQDDVIGIAGRNTTYMMPVGVACLLNCTPFHAITPILSEKNMAQIFDSTKPKLVFCDGQDYETVRAATKALKPLIYTMIDHIEGVPRVEDLLEVTQSESSYRPEALNSDGDQIVVILSSSGTTGLPKSVCMSNRMAYTSDFFHPDCITNEDVMYCASGLDWVTGLCSFLISTRLGCTRIISHKPFTAEYFVQLVQKYKITFSIVAPFHVAALINCATATTESLASLRYLSMGGGVISQTSLQRIAELLQNGKIAYLYGMTETGGMSGNYDAAIPDGSVGKLYYNVRVRILDDDGNKLGPNEVGEIRIHNGLFWSGYYKNPEETKAIQDDDGWLNTGDIGYFDDNQQLFVVDRKKNILKYGGMQFWPTEIEEVISELPEVADVCVIGVYDESKGDLAGALVVKVENAKLTAKDVEEYVIKRLPEFYKQLHAGVQFVEHIPQTPNGKTNRREVKLQFEKLLK